MLSLNTFRITLLALWMSSWIAMSSIVLGAEKLREDQAIGPTEQLEALLTLSPLWLTPLTCLAAFWFPESQRNEARDEPVSAAKVIAGIAFTVPYLAIVLYLVYSRITAPYPTEAELPAGESLLERVAGVVKFAGLLSPVALAPTLWLTRVGKVKGKPRERLR